MPLLAQTIEDLCFFYESHFYSADLWKNQGWFFKGGAPYAYTQGVFGGETLSFILGIGWNGKVHQR